MCWWMAPLSLAIGVWMFVRDRWTLSFRDGDTSSGRRLVNMLMLILDLAGTFVFALSGAMAGIKHRLDLFGILVLSFLAATAGGIIRDLLIGAVPPAAISDWRYVGISSLAGLLAFWWSPAIGRIWSPIQIFDAAGLGLFAVAGTLKALDSGLNPISAVLLGCVTGIGGGIVRDLLVTEIPTVLRAELYAVAALVGASVVVVGGLLQLPTAPAAVAGAFICFALRLGAIRGGWQLPAARRH